MQDLKTDTYTKKQPFLKYPVSKKFYSLSVFITALIIMFMFYAQFDMKEIWLWCSGKTLTF